MPTNAESLGLEAPKTSAESLGLESGSAQQEDLPGFFRRATAPIADIPKRVADEFREGAQQIREGEARLGSATSLGEMAGAGAETVFGGVQQFFSPVMGSARALVGDPAFRVLRVDREPQPNEDLGTKGKRFAAATAEDLATFFGPGKIAKIAPKLGEAAMQVGNAAVSPITGSTRFVKTAVGKEATAAGNALKSAQQEILERLGLNQKQEAEKYAERIGAAEKALGSLKSQPVTAETRAASRAARSENFSDERERVLDDLRSRSRALESEATAAGADAQSAKETVAAHEARVAEAETAVDDLEKQLLAKPTMGSEEFGKELRGSTEKLFKKYNTTRSAQAGFGEAVTSAGDTLRIDTSKMKAQIKDALKDVRNPTLESTLGKINGLLETRVGQNQENALTVKSSDSLRKYLDGILSSKQDGDLAVDKETLHVIGELRDSLVRHTEEAWTPYAESMSRYRELSRPLDIVERNGALRPILDADPISSAYKLTEAEVTKSVIAKAKAGNPVFSRLLQESPQLRDSARLAFAEDLLGKEKAPTEAEFRNWLRSNERPLKQLGLYDEFKEMKSAREAAGRAVAEAKGKLSESQVHARELDKAERGVLDKLKTAQSLRAKEASRVAETQIATEKQAEAARKVSDSRARTAESTLDRRVRENQSGMEQAQKVEDRIRQMSTELDSVPVKEATGKAQEIAKRLRGQGLIDDAKYGDILRRVQNVEAKYGKTADARSVLKKILTYTVAPPAAAALGYEVYKNTR